MARLARMAKEVGLAGKERGSYRKISSQHDYDCPLSLSLFPRNVSQTYGAEPPLLHLNGIIQAAGKARISMSCWGQMTAAKTLNGQLSMMSCWGGRE